MKYNDVKHQDIENNFEQAESVNYYLLFLFQNDSIKLIQVKFFPRIIKKKLWFFFLERLFDQFLFEYINLPVVQLIY